MEIRKTKNSNGTNLVVNVLSGPKLKGFGIIFNVFAVMVSWFFNKSVGWAILHFLFGWWYLLYSLVVGRFADGGFMKIINSFF